MTDPLVSRLVGSIRSSTATSHVGLTLDDGPDPETTSALVGLLRELGVQATFFVLTDRAEKHPELVRALVHAAHEVAAHGRDHLRVSTMERPEVAAYLLAVRTTLEELAGVPVRLYRPPYGSQSLSSYRAARAAGMDVVVWSADASDWVDREVGLVAADAVGAVEPGGILLLHERVEPDLPRAAPTTSFDRIELVRRVVVGLRERGLEPTTVSELARHGRLRRSAWFRP